MLLLTQLALLRLLPRTSMLSMHIPQEPLAEAANQTLWKLHATASAESDCDPLAASESGEVCCEREQSVVFRNLSDTQKLLCVAIGILRQPLRGSLQLLLSFALPIPVLTRGASRR